MKNKTSIPIDADKIRKGAALFVLLTLIAWILLIPAGISEEGSFAQRWQRGFASLKSSLGDADAFFISGAFCLVLIQMFLSVVKMSLILKAQDVSFSFVKTARFTLCPLFLSSITPLQSGGIAYQLYVLKKSGHNFSKSIALITFKSALNGLFLVIAFPLLLIYAGNAFKSGFFSGLSNYVLFFYLLVAIFFYSVMFRNRQLKKTAVFALHGKRSNPVAGFVFKLAMKFLNSVENLSKNYESFFFKHPLKTALAALIAIVEMGMYFLITPCLAMALSPDRNLAGLYATGMAISYILAYAPTPGGSGIAELSGMGFALSWNGPVTALILLWRIVAHYSPAVFGGFLLIFSVGRDIPQKKRPAVFDACPDGEN